MKVRAQEYCEFAFMFGCKGLPQYCSTVFCTYCMYISSSLLTGDEDNEQEEDELQMSGRAEYRGFEHLLNGLPRMLPPLADTSAPHSSDISAATATLLKYQYVLLNRSLVWQRYMYFHSVNMDIIMWFVIQLQRNCQSLDRCTLHGAA